MASVCTTSRAPRAVRCYRFAARAHTATPSPPDVRRPRRSSCRALAAALRQARAQAEAEAEAAARSAWWAAGRSTWPPGQEQQRQRQPGQANGDQGSSQAMAPVATGAATVTGAQLGCCSAAGAWVMELLAVWWTVRDPLEPLMRSPDPLVQQPQLQPQQRQAEGGCVGGGAGGTKGAISGSPKTGTGPVQGQPRMDLCARLYAACRCVCGRCVCTRRCSWGLRVLQRVTLPNIQTHSDNPRAASHGVPYTQVRVRHGGCR